MKKKYIVFSLTYACNSRNITTNLGIALQTELRNMVTKCDLVMIDKFGRLDDLEKMETITINPRVEEITAKVLALQSRIQREELEAADRLRAARDIYIAKTRDNTKLITKTLMLFNELQALYQNLEKHARKEVSEFVVDQSRT